MIRIPGRHSSSRKRAAPYERWALFGCRCLSLPAELPAEADVRLVEERQVEVAVAPLAVLVIDAHLLVLAKYTLLLAWRRHVGQRASVVEGIEHPDLRLLVAGLAMPLVIALATENLVARQDGLGWVLPAVERVTVRILEARNGGHH